MATRERKGRKATKSVVDVEVDVEEPIVVNAHNAVKTHNAVKEIEAEAESSLNGTAPSTVPQKRISDTTGDVDVNNLPEGKRTYYKEIAKVLNEKDLTSISSYGSDLQRAMDTYSSEFLNQSFSRDNNIESAELISNLLGELHEVNIDDLFQA